MNVTYKLIVIGLEHYCYPILWLQLLLWFILQATQDERGDY